MMFRPLALALLLLSGALQAFSNGQAASLVIGQADFTSGSINAGAIGANTVYRPRRFWTDGVKLAVADTDNNRVLIWDSFPTVNFQAADRVLGQANFTSALANRGGTVAADTLNYPSGIHFDGTRLWVADKNNNRVLWWNAWPSADGQAADGVVGQGTFTSNAAGTSTTVFREPAGMFVEGGKLFVADTYNHRVLIYNSVPAANGAAADLVLGQTTFTANTGGCAANKFQFPHHLEVAAGKLVVADTNNHRFLVFNSIPSASNTSADAAVGQSGLAACGDNRGGAAAANTVSWACGFHIDAAGDLWLADKSNSRVTRHSPLPSASNSAAGLVIGQAGLSTSAINWTGGATAHIQGLNNPYSVQRVGIRLIVSDTENHRLLVYQEVATATPTATPSATPTATPNAVPTAGTGSTCTPCTTVPGWHPIYPVAPGSGDLAGLMTPIGTLGFGTASWGGGAGAKPVVIDDGYGHALSGFIARAPRSEGWLEFAASGLQGESGLNMTFAIHAAAPAVEMALVDWQHQGYAVKLTVFGPGHADHGRFKVYYSNGAGISERMIDHTVPGFSIYGTGPLNDLDEWPGSELHPDGYGEPSVRYVLLNIGTCGLRLNYVNAWGTPANDFELPGFAPNAPGASYLVFGNQNGGGMPIDGWIDNLYRNECPAGTPTPSATPSPSSPTHTPTVTPTATRSATAGPSQTMSPTTTTLAFSATPSPTVTATPAGPTAEPTATVTKVKRDDDRVKCHPNHLRGRGQVMKILVRSFSGGQCGIKVNRGNGRVLADLWHGYLAPQEIRQQDWDGSDSQGAETPSGVYYVVFTDGDGSIQVQKVLIVR